MNRFPFFLLIIIAAVQSNGQLDVVDGNGGGDISAALDVVDVADTVDAVDHNALSDLGIASAVSAGDGDGGSSSSSSNLLSGENPQQFNATSTSPISQPLDINIISVSIDPPVALIFTCHPRDDTTAESTIPCEAPNEAELQLIATAAEEFIHENRMVESALQSEDMEVGYNRDGIVYEGTYLTASLSADLNRRRQLLENSSRVSTVTSKADREAAQEKSHLRGINVRHRHLKDGSNNHPILLTGTVNFKVPSNSYASDPSIPSKSHLSQVLLAILFTEEAAFLETLEEVVDKSNTNISGGWLSRVVGYEAEFGTDFDIEASLGIEGGEGDLDDASDNSSELDATIETTEEDVESQSDIEDNSDTTNSQANGDEENDAISTIVSAANSSVENESNNGSGSMNILLIVGAVGAGVSLLLLVAGLCYAKKSYKPDKNSGSNGSSNNEQQKPNNDVIFQPGKNNPRSASAVSAKKSSSFFKKKPSLSNSGRESVGAAVAAYSDPLPPPMPLGSGDPTQSVDDEDDESQADFLLARAALNNSTDNKDVDDDGASQANNTYGDDMSYAFTVEGESLAPLGTNNNNASSNNNNMTDEDIANFAIGAGGMASFANEKGVFRWNEEGTKMVYTPNVIEKTDGNEQNGFVYDERKKKWVVKEQVVGEKNVSFKQAAIQEGAAANNRNDVGAAALMRTRSNDSTGTGMTGMSEFTYDDIALDFAKRSRSEGTVSLMGMSSISNIGGGGMNVPPSPVTPDTPGTPGTPSEQGVEVTADTMLRPNQSNDSDEFVSNTNVERFMMGDDSTAFSGFTDFTNNNSLFMNNNSAGARPLPRPVTPERVSSAISGISDEATMATFDTGNPGRIIPKAVPNRKNKMKISEDAPFDEEDIPFDERVRTRSGRRSAAARGQSSSGSVISNSTGLVIPNMLDDMEEDEQSDSEASGGSANSEQVLKDLDTLSRFMMDRKQTSKKSGGSISSSRRSRTGGGGTKMSGGINSRRMGGRKSSSGSKGRSNRY